MINNECSICSNNEIDKHQVLFSVKNLSLETYEIRQCSHCHAVYTYFKHDVAMDTYYDEKDYTVHDTRKTIFYHIQRFEYTALLKKIKKLLPTATSLLDFGSGKGLFLHFAEKEGFKVKGIESSKPRAKYANETFGLDIYTTPYISGSAFENKFDVVTLFHVLEHILQPGTLLTNLVEGNLTNNGLLVVEVPNFDSWQSKWAGNKWLHLDVPRHLSHFTPKMLKDVLDKADCTLLKQSYFSFHLGIIGMVQTILGWFGYKGFLIGELKGKKNILLILKLLLVLPFAFLLELVAASFNKGAVIRFYAIKKTTGT